MMNNYMKKYNYSHKEVQEALDNTNSMSAVLRYLGHKYVTCRHLRSRVKKVIEDNELSLDKHLQNQKERHPFSSVGNIGYWAKNLDI